MTETVPLKLGLTAVYLPRAEAGPNVRASSTPRPRCEYMTLSLEPCQNPVRVAGDLCHVHAAEEFPW